LELVPRPVLPDEANYVNVSCLEAQPTTIRGSWLECSRADYVLLARKNSQEFDIWQRLPKSMRMNYNGGHGVNCPCER
jgi:hypothetical protein